MSAKKSSHDDAPDRGDVIWLELTPTDGHEQSGRRPALVLSERAFNERRGLALICPMTKSPSRSLFQIEIPANLAVNGTILADQVRMVDFNARHWRSIDVLPPDLVRQVLETVEIFLV